MKSILFIVNEHDDVSFDMLAVQLAASLSRSEFRVYGYSLKVTGTQTAHFRRSFGNRFYASSGIMVLDIFRIAGLLVRERINIIQTPALKSDAAAFLSRLLIRPFCRPIHIAVRHNYLFGEKQPYSFLKNIVYVLSCHMVDINICVARHIQVKLATRLGVPQYKIACIANGVTQQKNANETKQLRTALGLSPHIPIVLYVGKFIPRKNIPYLLSALADIHESYYCILVGDGPQKNEVQRTICMLGLDHRVMIQEHQPTGGYFGLADMFVLPSLDEGMSLALLEAMRAGLPCIVSNIEANTEVVRNGAEGIVVPLKRPILLTNAIRRLLVSKSLRCRMGQRAIRTARLRYTRERMFRQYKNVYVERTPRVHH